MTVIYRFCILITFISTFIFKVSFAQNDTVHDNSYYFDDGGISTSKNLIKLNVLGFVTGDIPVYYERTLGSSIGLEIGAGYQLPYFTAGLLTMHYDDVDLDMSNPINGYSLWIYPKYYFQKKAPELNYLGIQFRRRSINFDQRKVLLIDITFNYGFHLFVGKRTLLDFNAGIGFAKAEETTPQGIRFHYLLSNPYTLKICYIF